MIWIIAIAGVLVAGALFVVCSDISVRFRFSRQNTDDTITADIRALYGLIRYRYDVPMLYWDDGLRLKRERINSNRKKLLTDETVTIDRELVENYFRRLKLFLANTAKLVEWTKGVMSRTVCTEISWVTRVGLHDAADTAITTGAVWGLKTSLVGYMTRYMRFEAKPALSVQPQFNRTMFATEAVFRVKIKAVYAMLAMMILLRRILQVKGGLSEWRKLLFKPKPETT
ncbi:MAG: hypothetical protein K0Q59_228 [Paenibacillus sp.]|jgi:hypothetical protein|nr:hypothetical protein [Paenibacillus sp.]